MAGARAESTGSGVRGIWVRHLAVVAAVPPGGISVHGGAQQAGKGCVRVHGQRLGCGGSVWCAAHASVHVCAVSVRRGNGHGGRGTKGQA